jgi:DNA repair protein SbcD/Mre11
MKFIHIADCHLDGYKEEKLSKLGLDNFKYVIDFAIQKNVDFVLIAGDLFNSALPKIEVLKETTSLLSKLKDKNIFVYCIPGSHDFSPNGKTMLDVLEKANLLINVFKGKIGLDNSLVLDWTIDKKTKTHITGILGKKGMLDKEYYQKLDYNKLDARGIREFKIFMFHTAISEMIPKEMILNESYSIDILPKGFNYYAGGHVHVREKRTANSKQNTDAENQLQNSASDTLNGRVQEMINNYVVYPGPTFPNNFSELEKLKYGSFIFYDEGKINNEKIPNKEVFVINVDCENKHPNEIEEVLQKIITSEHNIVKNKIVLVRYFGKLSDGKTTDINFKNINRLLMDEGAYIVLKNTNKLLSKEFEEIVTEDDSEFFEEEIISEHLNQINLPKIFDEKKLIDDLIKVLDTEQYDGEKKSTFEERIVSDVKKVVENNK